MATTALDLIKTAMRQIGALASGETPTAAEGADGLEALNDMLAMWAVDGLLVPSETTASGALVVGQSLYTIGSTGNWTNARPLEITNLFIRDGSSDYPVDLVGSTRWAQVGQKTTNGPPAFAWYGLTAPNGSLQFNCPADSTNTAYYTAIVPLQSFAVTSTAVTLAPESLMAVRANLALALAPQFPGSIVSPELRAMAVAGKKALRGRYAAAQANAAVTDFIGATPGHFNIDTGSSL